MTNCHNPMHSTMCVSPRTTAVVPRQGPKILMTIVACGELEALQVTHSDTRDKTDAEMMHRR
jgi:hypothetical protein